MNSKRSLLLLGFLMISFLIFIQWQADFYAQPQEQTLDSPEHNTVNNADVIPESSSPVISQKTTGKIITISNDVLQIKINTQGGDVIESDMLKYKKELNSDKPFQLLQDDDLSYVAQSGLVGRDGLDNQATRPIYNIQGDNFNIQPNQNEIKVPLTFKKGDLIVTKTFILKKGSFAVNVDYSITNKGNKVVSLQPYGQIKYNSLHSTSGLTNVTYTGAAYSSSNTNYKKYSFDEMTKNNLNITTKAGWIALLQHYFVSAWIPNQDDENQFYSRVKDGVAYIGFRGEAVEIAPNQTKTIKSMLWTGPKLQKEMADVANHLDLTIDYGWAWFIAKPLFWLLTWLHSVVQNWGVAIILVTMVVKFILYPLTKIQYVSMAKLRLLAPKITELRERFADNRQKLNQEMMQLYQKEKVNPMGGCFPILLQMPIFIALYWTFIEAVELRHAPFFGWITDLSAPDNYFILPILMGASMFLLQKMSPSPVTDPVQQKVMLAMPIIFTVFFLFFPSGLVLYWLTSNIITILQQKLIYKKLEQQGLHTRVKK